MTTTPTTGSMGKSFLRKTAELVGVHSHGTPIQEPDVTYGLTADSLEALTTAEQPEIVRVFNLIKTLHDLVEAKALEQPFLIPIGERAAKIAEAFGERQLHTRSALEEFTALIKEAQEATEQYGASGLSMEGFAAYWFLRGRGATEAEAIGRRVGAAFERSPHWRTEPKQEQGVRVEMYKALIAGGVKTGSKEMVDDILANLRRANT